MYQLINVNTGELIFEDGFKISNKTTVENLLRHFGEDRLKKSEYVSGCYFTNQLQIDTLYFVFSFYFKETVLKKVGIEIETEPKKRIAWNSNRDLETNWLSQQAGDKSNFAWDMNIAGRHYHLEFPWGIAGVYYDFKNGTFETSINYL